MKTDTRFRDSVLGKTLRWAGFCGCNEQRGIWHTLQLTIIAPIQFFDCIDILLKKGEKRIDKKSKKTERQIRIIYKTIWTKKAHLLIVVFLLIPMTASTKVLRIIYLKNDFVELFDVIIIENGHGVVDNNNYDSIISPYR